MAILWPDITDNERMTAHQKENVTKAMRSKIGILCGSPGVGKTFCLAEIAKSIMEEFGQESMAVACPTGKAAVRITESLVACGVKVKAKTIHSLLGVSARSDESGWSFTHDESNPLPYSFLLLDESSMIDTGLAASLMLACSRECHVLWTGDWNQLPPVGHGAPLRDLIAADVPYGELREIRRNSGRIVEVCAQIRDSKRWSTSPTIDIKNGENLFCVPAATPVGQIEAMLEQLRAAKMNGLDPVWDCQILVPVNRKSPLARKELNRVLQDALNQSPAVGGSPFRPKDKIVNTKNGFFELDDSFPIDRDAKQADGKVFVANGELAEVLAVEEKLTIAKLSNPTRVIRIPRAAMKVKASGEDGKEDDANDAAEATDTGCTWDLGYALSVHKSQGSEWPIAIVMIDEYPGARRVCSREWIYTAISRAKKLCLLIGKKATADSFCKRQALNQRKTFLAESIRENLTRIAIDKEAAIWTQAIGDVGQAETADPPTSPTPPALRVFNGDDDSPDDTTKMELNSNEPAA